jgi:hypothetical protein
VVPGKEEGLVPNVLRTVFLHDLAAALAIQQAGHAARRVSRQEVAQGE